MYVFSRNAFRPFFLSKMGISGDQVTSVKATWGKVAPDMQKHGVGIFVNFLTAHPEQQAYFKKFASVAKDQLATNGEVAKQALLVMKALEKYVNVVDNAAGLKSATTAMAAQHKALGVGSANFAKMFPVIIDYVVSNAGADKAAWQACLDTIGEAIIAQQ